jgi:glycosyltransferase involved in cell wall biosynthesis
MDEPWADVEAAGTWLLRIAEDVKPDVVHLNGYAHASLEWKAPVVCVAHSCVASWWRAVKGEPAPDRYDEYRRRVRSGLNAATLVVAPTHAMLRSIEEEHGALANGCVIPNGRSGAMYTSAVKEPFVLATGRLWDEAKNIAALDGIAAALPWPVYVAGDTRHPEGREAALQGLRPLGHLEPAQLAEWYARASVYALPARYEPFGLSALEAALSGCALVLGDIPSLREVWDDAAIYVDPNDAAALSDALERVIRSTTLREDLARRAGLRARRYTPERMYVAYQQAWDRAAHRFRMERKRAA